MKSIISHNLWDFEALTRVAATIPATLSQQSLDSNNIQFYGLKNTMPSYGNPEILLRR